MAPEMVRLHADGNLVLAAEGRLWLREEALGMYDDLGVGQEVVVVHAGDELAGVVSGIAGNGMIKVALR